MSAPHSTPTGDARPASGGSATGDARPASGGSATGEEKPRSGSVAGVVSPVGRVVAERYRLEKVLGEGAMGSVYLAEHVHMRKRYAMKILHPEIASAEIIARFEREAVAAANITHPNIAGATDFGRLEDGGFFLVLEYVAGKDLRSAIDQGAMPPRRALGIVKQILAAIGAAHAKGVVHRDLKPENVMLVAREDGEDHVKVLDFGIAKLDHGTLGDASESPLTRMGAVYGTPAYMAPEQGMGKPVDGRSDLYAVGVILFELIAGHPPYEGDGIMVIAKHVNDPIPPLQSPIAALPPAVCALADKLLAKERDDRPADAQAALALLEEAESALPIETSRAATVYGETPATATTSPRPPGVRFPTQVTQLARKVGVSERVLVAFAAAGAATLLLLIILLIARSGKNEDEDAEHKPRRRGHVTATADPSASASTAVKTAPSPAPSESSMGALPPPNGDPSGSPSATSGPVKKKGGGGGIGSKIKSIFK